MAARLFLVLCASALLVQSIAAYSGCGCGQGAAGAINFGGWGNAAPAYAPASNYKSPAIASSSGGAFGVSLFSPYAPRGISVLSENSLYGDLEVFGNLPVLAAVAFDGTVPSSGAAGTSHSCGCGNVGISSESLAAAGLSAADLSAASGWAGAKLARPSCRCGDY